MLIVDMLSRFLECCQGEMHRHREQADNVLRDLSHVLIETEFYCKELRLGGENDSCKERELAHEWSDISVKIRFFDAELSKICFIKSGYWINPETWDEARIEDSHIGLEEVRKKCEDLCRRI